MADVDRSEAAVSEERVASLLAAMTTAEKVSLLAGASMWLTTPVERLGIPAIKVSDGPNGVRGDNPLIRYPHRRLLPGRYLTRRHLEP